jgi:hypothetical protein
MSDENNLRAKADLMSVLRRAGIPGDTVQTLESLLPDPVDLRRDGDLLARYGVTRDGLIDRMGGSP